MNATATAATKTAAVETVGHICDKCYGTGTWDGWHGAEACFRCLGKGYQTPADVRRNRAYDAHRATRDVMPAWARR